MTEPRKISLADIESLEQLRGELAVQAHLLKAELQDRWTELEADWDRLQTELGPVRSALQHSAAEVGTAASLLLQSLQDGYTEISKSVKR